MRFLRALIVEHSGDKTVAIPWQCVDGTRLDELNIRPDETLQSKTIGIDWSSEQEKIDRLYEADGFQVIGFQAGDIVFHKPSCEEWVLATDQRDDYVMPAGWPETMAKAKDCQLITRATPGERIKMLNDVAKGQGISVRKLWAIEQLDKQVMNLDHLLATKAK